MKHILLSLISLGTISLCSAQEQWTSVQVMPEGGSVIYTPQTGGEFGWSSASDGDWAIVGTLTDKAVIYYRNPGTGMLETTAQVQAVPPVQFNDFGIDVDISGETAVVGAPFDGTSGAAFVYKYDDINFTWDFQEKLEPSDGGANDRFGERVAIDGDNIIIGARSHNKGRGAAYMYKRNGNTWTEYDKWAPSEINKNDGFGSDVAIHGDTMLASSVTHYNGQVGYTGAAWLMRDNGTEIVEMQKLIADTGQWDFYDDFGASVFLNAEYAMVGATGSNISGIDAGAVFPWKVGSTDFERMMVIMPEEPVSGMRCGTAIEAHKEAPSKYKVFIGCPGTNGFEGAVVTGQILANMYFQSAKVVSQQPGTAQGFGQSVASFSGQFAGGANYGTSQTTDSGTIELFEECDEVINSTINWTGTWLESQEFDAQQYTWYLNAGPPDQQFPLQVGTGMNYMPQGAGTFYLVIQKNGCISITTITVQLVGIENALSDEDIFNVFPNPAKDQVRIQLNGSEFGTVKIFNLQGQQILSRNNASMSIDIPLNNVPSGSYVIEYCDKESRKSLRKKLQVIR